MSSITVDFRSEFAVKLFGNIQFVAFRLPAFFMGYMLAPYAKNDKKVSVVWMVILPLIIVATMRFFYFGNWPGFFGSSLNCFFLFHP